MEVSPSGKARVFDIRTRWFESSHLCHTAQYPSGHKGVVLKISVSKDP